MSLYEGLIIVHILAAAILIGAPVVIGGMLARLIGSGDERDIIGFTNVADLAGRIFGPTALVLLITGIWGASEGNWDFGDAWISIGFAAWIALTIVGVTFHRVNGRRTREVVEQQGAGSAAALVRLRRTLMVLSGEFAVLAVVVWAMVAKPGL